MFSALAVTVWLTSECLMQSSGVLSLTTPNRTALLPLGKVMLSGDGIGQEDIVLRTLRKQAIPYNLLNMSILSLIAFIHAPPSADRFGPFFPIRNAEQHSCLFAVPS